MPLRLEGVEVSLGRRVVLHPLSCTIEAGECIGIIGPNGAGKSTLLKAIAQLLPYRGRIWLGDEPLDRLAPEVRARHLSYLAQADRVSWPLAAYDLVALGRRPYRRGWQWGDDGLSEKDRKAIEEAMRATDCWSLRARSVETLSGGERARVRLARALAVEAPVLLADEPVAALDPRHRLEVMALLRAQTEGGKAVIIVLHDLSLTSRFCDRLLLLDRGQSVGFGPALEVLSPESLGAVYGIEALIGRYRGEPYVLPWSCHEMP
ncbi:ABC transporter ATP-binding protein [Caldichromatium japonicum]|uniref:ABC transporter ATP-binding protein n=1 Tax=Caldichromatium japonicum TaxID=2699430 RepID=A0A6G7VC92_9GAMM|nr:ABC transporter ATP-binding protein [Caldichromatium japonicum]QIK37584.1 ABC transporter ATP-binding protein [Caldichromatium japonicum]